MFSIFKKKPRHVRAPKEIEKRANEAISILLNEGEFKFTPFETALIFTRVAVKLDKHFADQAAQRYNDSDAARKEAEEFIHAQQTAQTFLIQNNG